MATKKLSAFEQAFADARKDGKKEFEFKGKKFNTRLASDEAVSVGGKPKLGEYKPRDSDARKGEEMTSKNYVPRDSDARKGEAMTSKNYKPRDNYVRSGQQSMDTETEFVPPDMSAYKPRRTPGPLSDVTKPGTGTNYENTDISDMSFKRGGSVPSASRRGDGIAQRGKTKGRLI
jgi:hypothetical protein